MEKYLCYDIKGIQHYIFAIPKLKYCIGGSRQIDDFDKNDTKGLPQDIKGCQLIFAGGGKGAFHCDDEDVANKLKMGLVKLAHGKGLTIRFGCDENYENAAKNITDTYCYQPESLDGHPCSVSGMYPTTSDVHPLMKEREKLGSEHGYESQTETKLLEQLKERTGKEYSFFYNVKEGDYGSHKGDPSGDMGYESLGCRNRWAVICMDGNDIGMQFTKFKEAFPYEANKDKWREWLPVMSQELDECTRAAFVAGMLAVEKEYSAFVDKAYSNGDERKNVLPMRPLIVGGDDVTVLVGCNYAMTFVKAVVEEFTKHSRECKKGQFTDSSQIWVGTGGSLAISAGILYAPVTLPLHSALDYAELLLKSAKTKGRALKKTDALVPSPACLDWESVTEGLIESPASRRQREFKFTDFSDDKEECFELTCRPYSLEEFSKLETIKGEMQKLPGTVQNQMHRNLFAPKAARLAFYARLAKNHAKEASQLMEPVSEVSNEYGEYWENETSGKCVIHKTRIIDALLLLQEEHRIAQGQKQLEEAIK